MIWFSLYTATALVIGAALFVLAESKAAPGPAAPRQLAICALVAGFLWPVLLIGAAQCGLVLAVSHRLSRPVAPPGGGTARLAQALRWHAPRLG